MTMTSRAGAAEGGRNEIYVERARSRSAVVVGVVVRLIVVGGAAGNYSRTRSQVESPSGWPGAASNQTRQTDRRTDGQTRNTTPLFLGRRSSGLRFSSSPNAPAAIAAAKCGQKPESA